MAPEYLVELNRANISIRSSNKLLLTIPQVGLKSKGDRDFAVAGLRLWNDLPIFVRSSPTFNIFRFRVKCHLFSLAF